MAEKSYIQWCDATWNVARGCTKVSEGCKYCYMMRDAERYGFAGMEVKRTKTVFNFPLKLKLKTSEMWDGPPLVFTSSLTDFFHPAIDSYRAEAWDIIRKCPHLVFQILTKRPERIVVNRHLLPMDWDVIQHHVWLGASVENQERYNERMYLLSKIQARTKFLSIEPLLENIVLDFNRYPVDWVIIGGESGNGSVPEDVRVNYGYRRCEMRWIWNIIKQCKAAGVPVFVKQLGSHLGKTLELADRSGGTTRQWGPEFQVREFPNPSTSPG